MAQDKKLKVKIIADASQAKTEINKFKTSLTGVKDQAKEGVSGLAGMTAEMGKLAIAAGAVVAAVRTMAAATKNAIEVAALGDEIKDQAQKVFMSTTAYQEWGYVLEQNGVNMSALKMAMRSFSKEVASGGSALAQYGVTSKNIEEAFGQAVSAIQNCKDETEKVAMATQMFGARATELMPIFNLTNMETQNLMATYRALGGTMSNELIAASDVCTDSITALKASWQGLKNTLGQVLIPVITKVVQWLTVAIAKIRILLSAFFGLKSTFGGSKSNTKTLVGGSGSVAKNTGSTAKNLKNASKAAKELRRSLLKIDELTKLAAKASSTASGGGGGGGSIGDIGGGDIGGGMDEILTDKQLESIQRFQEKIENIKDKLSGLKDLWQGFIKLLVFHDLSGLDNIREGLVKIFPGLEKVFNKWDEFKKSIGGKVLEARVSIEEKIASIKEKWDNFKKAFADKTVALKASLPSASDLKKKWNNLVKKIKDKKINITIGFKNLLTSAWNAIAKKVNAARSKSALAKSVLPQMPMLAKGGILTAPTVAMMGEYAGAKSNPEIATPQKLMYQTMMSANGEMVGAFAQMTQQVIAAIERKDLSVSIGDETIASSAQRGNKAHYQRTGKALITV